MTYDICGMLVFFFSLTAAPLGGNPMNAPSIRGSMPTLLNENSLKKINALSGCNPCNPPRLTTNDPLKPKTEIQESPFSSSLHLSKAAFPHQAGLLSLDFNMI